MFYYYGYRKQCVIRSVTPLQQEERTPQARADAPGLTAGDSPSQPVHRTGPALIEHVCVWN